MLPGLSDQAAAALERIKGEPALHSDRTPEQQRRHREWVDAECAAAREHLRSLGEPAWLTRDPSEASGTE